MLPVSYFLLFGLVLLAACQEPPGEQQLRTVARFECQANGPVFYREIRIKEGIVLPDIPVYNASDCWNREDGGQCTDFEHIICHPTRGTCAVQGDSFQDEAVAKVKLEANLLLQGPWYFPGVKMNSTHVATGGWAYWEFFWAEDEIPGAYEEFGFHLGKRLVGLRFNPPSLEYGSTFESRMTEIEYLLPRLGTLSRDEIFQYAAESDDPAEYAVMRCTIIAAETYKFQLDPLGALAFGVAEFRVAFEPETGSAEKSSSWFGNLRIEEDEHNVTSVLPFSGPVDGYIFPVDSFKAGESFQFSFGFTKTPALFSAIFLNDSQVIGNMTIGNSTYSFSACSGECLEPQVAQLYNSVSYSEFLCGTGQPNSCFWRCLVFTRYNDPYAYIVSLCASLAGIRLTLGLVLGFLIFSRLQEFGSLARLPQVVLILSAVWAVEFIALALADLLSYHCSGANTLISVDVLFRLSEFPTRIGMSAAMSLWYINLASGDISAMGKLLASPIAYAVGIVFVLVSVTPYGLFVEEARAGSGSQALKYTRLQIPRITTGLYAAVDFAVGIMFLGAGAKLIMALKRSISSSSTKWRLEAIVKVSKAVCLIGLAYLAKGAVELGTLFVGNYIKGGEGSVGSNFIQDPMNYRKAAFHANCVTGDFIQQALACSIVYGILFATTKSAGGSSGANTSSTTSSSSSSSSSSNSSSSASNSSTSDSGSDSSFDVSDSYELSSAQ